MNKNLKNVLLIFIVSFNLRLGISSVPPLIAAIKSTLQLTNFKVSLLTSVPVICMGLFAFFISRFQRRFGRRVGILGLLMLLGLATLSRIFVQSYLGLLSSALLIGFSVAITGPLLSGFIKEEFPNKSGLLIGIYSLGMGLGSVSASSMTSWLTSNFSDNYSVALGIWGVPALLTAIIWFLYAPKEDNKGGNKENQQEPFPLKDSSVWKMILFFGVQSGIFYGLITWITEFFRFKQISSAHSILLLTTFTSVQMLCSFLIPALMDKYGKTSSWIMFCSLCTMLGSVLLIVFSIETMYAIGVILLAIGTGGFFPIAMLFPIQATQTPDEASLWTGVTQSFGYIIGGLLPIFMGVIIDLTNNYNSLTYQIIIGSLLLALVGGNLAKKLELTTNDRH
ncbi:MFS transporter [Enterococcus sp. BWM-S5]|uniref:MFS transporter n=1 Tax=Enterococcus larvae TaxID=2794352 RepID=A0ABS4CJC1_9ENTE|nr:MFS transporter [Enterococcus larvae]MBP1046656.1 MFS transporter [Enterococcus larvae]